MFSKTIFVAAAVAATAAAQSAEDFPTCWASCFAEYNIKSQDCLCKDSLKDVVSSCIASGCEEADNASYEAWLSSYCYVAPVSSNTWPVPSSYIPVPSSYAVPVPSSYPAPAPSGYPSEPASYPEPKPSSYPAPVPSSYPAPSGYPSYSAVSSIPYPSYSVCTYTTTYIWRSTTSCGVATKSAVPSGYPSAPVKAPSGGAPAGSWPAASYPAATGTGAVYPSASGYYPVPATGAGAKVAGVSFGVAGLVAGVAAVLL